MRRFIALCAAAALFGTAACSDSKEQPSTPGKPDDVNVGVIAIVDVAPIYLGKQQGIFSKHNINLTLTTAQGGAAIVPAVVNTSLDADDALLDAIDRAVARQSASDLRAFDDFTFGNER